MQAWEWILMDYSINWKSYYSFIICCYRMKMYQMATAYARRKFHVRISGIIIKSIFDIQLESFQY